MNYITISRNLSRFYVFCPIRLITESKLSNDLEENIYDTLLYVNT